MPLSNIRKGISKVLIGQILDLVATVMTTVASAIFYGHLNVSELEGTVDLAYLAEALTVSLIAFTSAILYVTAVILYIIGLLQASKEEVLFRVALICFCVCVPLRIVSMCFFRQRFALLHLSETMMTLINMMALLYLIQGVRRTADLLDNKKMEKRGDNFFRLITLICVTEAFGEIAVIIITDTPAEVITPVISTLVFCLAIAQYILLILFLINVLRMIKKEQALSEKPADSEMVSEK